MSRALADLEAALAGLIAEHRKLLELARGHEKAVRTFDLKAMDTLAGQQQACRLRLIAHENRRRAAVEQLAKALRLEPNVTLSRIADLHPTRRDMLLRLRAELKGLAAQVAATTKITGRVTAAVLGHLNTAIRLLAGAVERAGLYTKQGIPQVSRRIGVMEAVG
jgi:hypothetical protein